MKKQEMSSWEYLKEFINLHENGDIIQRRGMIQYVFDRINQINERQLSRNATGITLDCYRRALTINNILSEPISRGAYVKKHNIPIDLTVTNLIESAYKIPSDPIFSNRSSIFDLA